MIGEDMSDMSFFMRNFLFSLIQKFGAQSAECGALGLIKDILHPDAKGGTLYGPKEMAGNAKVNTPELYEREASLKIAQFC